jgi:hypothetical protein
MRSQVFLVIILQVLDNGINAAYEKSEISLQVLHSYSKYPFSIGTPYCGSLSKVTAKFLQHLFVPRNLCKPPGSLHNLSLNLTKLRRLSPVDELAINQVFG